MSGVVGGAVDPGDPGDRWRGAVPVAVLVLLNLIPLAGVLWLGWDLFSILVLYWLESGVIGVVNVFKIRRSAGAAPAGVQTTIGGVTIRGAPTMGSQSSGCIAAFFAFHYGLFWVVHGVFVFVLFAGASLDGRGILVALMGLSAYHVVEYWYGFVGKGEYRRVSPAAQMARPYGRVFVLHLTIVFGAILVVVLGRPIVLVALLATLKTAIDVGLYAFARSGRRTAGVRT